MRLLTSAVSGAVIAGALAVTTAAPAAAKAADYYLEKWGVIGRNTLGDPSAVLRLGPWGRLDPGDSAATQPPPYGIGSLGLIVGSATDKISFGNETDFAGLRLRDIDTLKYWVYAGMDSLAGVTVPNITIEVDPNQGDIDYTSLVYVPEQSVSPSAPSVRAPQVWQQYDASADGSRWYMTRPGELTSCTQGSPCSFADLKALLPDAVVTLSLGISKGRDTPFNGAVDGVQVNRNLYDFEPLGVRKFTLPA